MCASSILLLLLVLTLLLFSLPSVFSCPGIESVFLDPLLHLAEQRQKINLMKEERTGKKKEGIAGRQTFLRAEKKGSKAGRRIKIDYENAGKERGGFRARGNERSSHSSGRERMRSYQRRDSLFDG